MITQILNWFKPTFTVSNSVQKYLNGIKPTLRITEALKRDLQKIKQNKTAQ